MDSNYLRRVVKKPILKVCINLIFEKSAWIKKIYSILIVIFFLTIAYDYVQNKTDLSCTYHETNLFSIVQYLLLIEVICVLLLFIMVCVASLLRKEKLIFLIFTALFIGCLILLGIDFEENLFHCFLHDAACLFGCAH